MNTITITPPLTLDEIQSFGAFRTVECYPAENGGAGELRAREGMNYYPHFMRQHIQDIVDHFPEHEFAGFVEARNPSPDQPPVSRYVVSDGRVETVTPRLVWPGESVTLEQLAAEQGVEPYDSAKHPVASLTQEEAAFFNAALATCDGTHPVLDLPMGENDALATTVREYLTGLLAALWDEKEGFSGKRPYGNSGWECDLYRPLVTAGLIAGTVDEYGDFDDLDDDAGDALIAEAIRALGAGA